MRNEIGPFIHKNSLCWADAGALRLTAAEIAYYREPGKFIAVVKSNAIFAVHDNFRWADVYALAAIVTTLRNKFHSAILWVPTQGICGANFDTLFT